MPPKKFEIAAVNSFNRINITFFRIFYQATKFYTNIVCMFIYFSISGIEDRGWSTKKKSSACVSVCRVVGFFVVGGANFFIGEKEKVTKHFKLYV